MRKNHVVVLLGGLILGMSHSVQADVRVSFSKMSISDCDEIGVCDWRLACALGNQTKIEFFKFVEANTNEEIDIDQVLTQREFPPVTVNCEVQEHDGGIGAEWEDVPSSPLTVTETYLLTCMRYIELNPVRATIVEDPAHYRWTSYRANGLGQTSSLLVPHSVYLSLGATDKERQAAYRHLFRYHLDEEMVSELRLAVNQNQPLGNERFYETIERMTGQRREARPLGRPRLSANVANEDVKGQGDLGL